METKTDTIEAQIEISEKSKIAVTITGKRFTAKVPWTGIQTKYYTDGSIATQKVTGTVFAMELFEPFHWLEFELDHWRRFNSSR